MPQLAPKGQLYRRSGIWKLLKAWSFCPDEKKDAGLKSNSTIFVNLGVRLRSEEQSNDGHHEVLDMSCTIDGKPVVLWNISWVLQDLSNKQLQNIRKNWLLVREDLNIWVTSTEIYLLYDHFGAEPFAQTFFCRARLFKWKLTRRSY